jgi:probable HAF family extracellular repeat protein
MRTQLFVASFALAALPHGAAADASFTGLGSLAPNGESWAYGVAQDGTVVGVGRNDGGVLEAFRWKDGAMTGLGGPDVPGCGSGGVLSLAEDVSALGAAVVGYACNAGAAFRWEAGLMGVLPASECPAGSGNTRGLGVSVDGSVVAGVDCDEAVRWQDGQRLGLGFLPGAPFPYSYATDVSDDGAVVVGVAASSSNDFVVDEAFRWVGGVMTGLGSLAGFEASSDFTAMSGASAVSQRGDVVVGTATNAAGQPEAFRWEGGAMVGLGDLPGGPFWSGASGVSGDGARVVGVSSVALGNEYRAFLWDAATGEMEDLKALLEARYGLDLGGWTLRSADAISLDGRRIAGVGTNPAGRTEAYLATLPPACSDRVDNDGDGLTDWDGGLEGGVPDPQCRGRASHASERAAGCGLGAEIALALPLLLAASRRARPRGRRGA